MFVLLCVSCKTQTKEKSKIQTESKDFKMTPDFNVALKFINDYTDFCKTKSPALIDSTWIERNPLLTENFKTSYKNLLDSAYKADPDLGLDYDPIFYAQDFDDKGFLILSADTATGYVTVIGKEWKEFTLVMKVVYQNNKWLVGGSGIINIPVNKRPKR
jgi:hypothetical protein